MAMERLSSRAGRLNTSRMEAVVTDKAPVSAPGNVGVQAAPLKPIHHAAAVWARCHSQNSALNAERYKRAGVMPLVPTFDLLRPRG